MGMLADTKKNKTNREVMVLESGIRRNLEFFAAMNMKMEKAL